MTLSRWILIATIISLLPVVSVHAQDTDDANKAQAIAMIQAAYNFQGDMTILDTIFADDFLYHPGGGGKDALLDSVFSLRAAMPDLRTTPIITVSEGGWVAAHLHVSGRFMSDLILPDSQVTATGGRLEIVTNVVFQFNPAGQISQQWILFDNLSYLSQLQINTALPSSWVGPLEPVTLADVPVAVEPVVNAYYNAFRAQDTQALQTTLDGTYVGYNPFGEFDRPGQVNELSVLLGSFPDLQLDVTQIITEGQYAAILYNMNGTFAADLNTGSGIIPATGGPLDIIRIDFVEVSPQGTITEIREVYDSLDFFTQLDAVTVGVLLDSE
ncbi:MAG: ester cyclase [Chloroflexota bacterium]